jgi:hypothetical protein
LRVVGHPAFRLEAALPGSASPPARPEKQALERKERLARTETQALVLELPKAAQTMAVEEATEVPKSELLNSEACYPS